MTDKLKDKPHSRLPSTWRVEASRVTAPGPQAGRVGARPRAEGAPPADPEKEKLPEAADGEGMTVCPKCKAEVALTEPPAKFCPSCGEQLPAEDDAKEPPPGEAAAFAGYALKLTGAKSLQSARGTISAWKAGAARYDAVAGELASAHAELEQVHRERLLERAVAEGALEPAEAWSFSVGEDGKKVRSFSDWAGPPNAAKGTGQSLAQLAAYVKEPRPGAARASRSLTPSSAKAPPKPAPHGVNAEMYAAAAAQVAATCGEGARQ